MNLSYLNIKNIKTLGFILQRLKELENKTVMVFLDWDDTLCNPDDNCILEPEITKQLFDYMLTNNIFFSIITGRYQNSACDDTKRRIKDMRHNVVSTIYPQLISMGVPLYKYPLNHTTVDKVYNEKGECVGVLYMGIFFTGKKGETVKNYIRTNFKNLNMKMDHVLFVDDYEQYLSEISNADIDGIEIYRRIPPYETKY